MDMSAIRAKSVPVGERLPTISRTMNFRVTVRDNRRGGGAVDDAQSTVTVGGTAGPFQVTVQNTPEIVPGKPESILAPEAVWQGDQRKP